MSFEPDHVADVNNGFLLSDIDAGTLFVYLKSSTIDEPLYVTTKGTFILVLNSILVLVLLAVTVIPLILLFESEVSSINVMSFEYTLTPDSSL